MLIPSARLSLLVALGGAGLLPGLGRPGVLAAALGYNLLLIAVCLADALATVGRERIFVRREGPTTLNLGIATRFQVIVENRAERPVTIVVRDRVPAHCGEDPTLGPVRLAPGERWEASYRLTPGRRGPGEFGGVTARWRSPLGLFERQAHWPLGGAVKVYPNLRALQRQEWLSRAGRLLEAGLRAARLRGAGAEFESLREYQPDDPYRRIHWGATARRGKLISRQYEVERCQTVMLCLDVGRLMTTHLGELPRLDHAIHALLMLAGVANRLQDRVGLIVFAEEPLVYLPARHGGAQMTRILEAVYGVEGRLVEPDYGAALRLLGLRQRKRSLVVLFTDLVDEHASEALLTYTTALRPAHLPIFVSFEDPAVLTLATRSPRSVADVYERALAADVLAQRAAALERLRAHGIAVVSRPPDAAPAELVHQYIEAKVRLLL